MVLSKSSAEATGVVAKGDILEVVDEKSTQVWKLDCSTTGPSASDLRRHQTCLALDPPSKITMIIRPNLRSTIPSYAQQRVSSDGCAWNVVQGVSLPQLRDMILGKAGSYVILTFLREKDGEGFRYDIELMRGDPNTVRRNFACCVIYSNCVLG
jgi:hypothetical protein